MNDIQALTEIDLVIVFIGLFILLYGGKAIIMLRDYFFDRFGIETKKMRKEREDHELLVKTAESLNALREKHELDNENSEKHDDELNEKITTFITEAKYEIKNLVNDRLYDRECTREMKAEFNGVQNKIFETLNQMSEKIDTMKHETDERFEASEERENKRHRAELKDRIGQSYRHYHALGKINDIELEALEDLIKEYESAKGENSFVHSVVQKEMYTWEQVDRF